MQKRVSVVLIIIKHFNSNEIEVLPLVEKIMKVVVCEWSGSPRALQVSSSLITYLVTYGILIYLQYFHRKGRSFSIQLYHQMLTIVH